MGKKIMYCAACEESFAEKFTFCPNCAAVLSTYEMNPVLTEAKKKESTIFYETKAKSDKQTSTEDGFYNVTLVEERSGKTRQALLLGAALLVMGGAIIGLIGSIYNADVYVGALDDSLIYLANVSDDNPTKTEELELPEDRKEGHGSGGGGGGRKDKQEVSKGDLPPQFKEKPFLTPSKEDISVSNPTIPVIRATKGPNDIIPEKRSKTNGLPNSTYEVASDGNSDANSGMGTDGDGGIGVRGRDGVGRDGEGGIGTKKGDKYGNREGSSEDADRESEDDRAKERDIPPSITKGVTVALKILDKPRAIYTNDARKNQIAGTVTLRVTFNANGSIGNIAVVTGLSDGLTEQAIAAARNIRFEPARRNGVAQTVSKQVQYTFTLY